jgi:hypothetical protein
MFPPETGTFGEQNGDSRLTYSLFGLSVILRDGLDLVNPKADERTCQKGDYFQ